jgi:AAA+ ATPase superfamily predicted ATPase
VRRTFVDRGREFDFFEQRFASGDRQLLVIYGRRRVGKTALVTEYLTQHSSDHVYFLADQRGTAANATRFAEKCADTFDDIPPVVDGFDTVFEYIVRRIDDEFVVVIDEFSYLVEEDEAIPSIFQRIHDDILADSRISVILLGSSISMMEEGALSHESPLYGRRTGQWKLSPLHFVDACAFFPAYTIEDLIRVYAVLGGVPAYLEQFDPETALADSIRERVLTKGTFLYEEPEFFLRQELREPATYMAILEAMAAGNTTVTEIANAIGRDAKGMSRYLQNLQRLEIVDRLVPITDPTRKQGIYTIADEFFSFWFRFVYPNRSDLEQGNVDAVTDAVVDELDLHTSRVFETICRQAVQHPAFPVSVSRTGTWWYKENEIDVAAVHDKQERLVLGECKWTTNSVGSELLKELEQTAPTVRWRGDDRNECFVLFSKSGFTDTLEEIAHDHKDLHLYDLPRLATLFEITDG